MSETLKLHRKETPENAPTVSKSALIKALYTERAAMLNNNCFRAWDEKENLMMHGDFIEENYPTYTAGMSYGKLFVANSADGEWYECVVMQWTGLYDKTGHQIFEGDIVVNGLSGTWIVQPMENGSYSLLGVCEKYKDSNFLISALNDEVKLIGNIYENPELLTK